MALEIPKKWQIKKLGEICKITTGSSNTIDAVEDGEYAFFDRSKTIKRSNRFLFDGEALIVPGEGQTFFPRHYCGKFDLHQRAYALLNFTDNADIKFVENFLIFNHKYFERVAVGATAKSLRRRHFEDLEIPLPPICEQKRLVALLDNLFEKLGKAKENTEKNLKNAKELFETYLDSIIINPSKSWKHLKLSDVITHVEYGSSKKSHKEGKVPVLGMGNIQNGRFEWTKLKYTNSESEIRQYNLKYNDVLFNRTNSPELVGKTAIYKGEMPAIFAGYLIRIHRNEDLLDGDYLNYYLNSNFAISYGRSVMTSSVNQANISGSKLKDYPIIVPSLKGQQEIVSHLNSLSEQTQKLEAIYKQKITSFYELKQSILHQAFTAKL